MKGDSNMSDEWVATTVARIKRADEELRMVQEFQLMKERKLGSHEHEMFGQLQKLLKAGVEKLNAHFDKSRHFSVKGEHYDEITVLSYRSEVSLDLKFDFDAHELTYDLYAGQSQPTTEGKAPLGLNEEGELRFMFDGKPIGTERLAETLLDALIEHSM
jgi:hypothetical protein